MEWEEKAKTVLYTTLPGILNLLEIGFFATIVKRPPVVPSLYHVPSSPHSPAPSPGLGVNLSITRLALVGIRNRMKGIVENAQRPAFLSEAIRSMQNIRKRQVPDSQIGLLRPAYGL